MTKKAKLLKKQAAKSVREAQRLWLDLREEFAAAVQFEKLNPARFDAEREQLAQDIHKFVCEHPVNHRASLAFVVYIELAFAVSTHIKAVRKQLESTARELTCAKHPRYEGQGKPTSSCPKCHEIYERVHVPQCSNPNENTPESPTTEAGSDPQPSSETTSSGASGPTNLQ